MLAPARPTAFQRDLWSLPAIYQRSDPPRVKKVAILGFASSSRDLAPYRDESWEIWGMNNAYGWMPRANRWFEMHDRWKFPQAWGEDHLKKLQNFECPVYCVEKYEDIGPAVRYPIEDATRISGLDYPYFTNSVSFMLALAILEKFTHISVYGCEMLLDSEYAYQRPNLEFWVTLARERGIKVFLPPQSGLMRANYVYGYEARPEEGAVKRFAVEQRLAQYENDIQAGLQRAHTLQGAQSEDQEILKGIGEGGWDLEEVKKQLAARAQGYQTGIEQALATVHMINGAKQEADHNLTMIKHWERGGQVPGPLETGD